MINNIFFLPRKKKYGSLFKNIELTNTDTSKKLADEYDYFLRLDEFKFLCVKLSSTTSTNTVWLRSDVCNFALLNTKIIL